MQRPYGSKYFADLKDTWRIFNQINNISNVDTRYSLRENL